MSESDFDPSQIDLSRITFASRDGGGRPGWRRLLEQRVDAGSNLPAMVVGAGHRLEAR